MTKMFLLYTILMLSFSTLIMVLQKGTKLLILKVLIEFGIILSNINGKQIFDKYEKFH